MRRAEAWALRVRHESTLWPDNSFVTLTYGRDQLPPNSSLEHADVQKFLKRLRFRRSVEKGESQTIRYYMCGEYGPLNGRPHYHMCLFNEGFRNDRVPLGTSKSGAHFYGSAELDELWTHGRASVQDLTPQTASYCARYIMKKALGKTAENAYDVLDPETGEIIKRKPEYAAMSLKPGIGAAWFEKFGKDVFPHDFVVQEGAKLKVPSYYDKLLKRSVQFDLDRIEYERYLRGLKQREDNTDERRAVREKVHLAKVSTLTRGDL